MFQIDIMSRVPVYEQIISQTERFVLTGLMPVGEQLPSVRSLSIQLSINPNTIQKAYTELDRRGIIYSVPGKGCFVAENAVSLLSQHKRKQLSTLEDLVYELAIAGVSEAELTDCIKRAIARKGEMKV